MWAENRQSGKGRVVHIDGDTYDGSWEDGKATGYGVYRCSDGITRYDSDTKASGKTTTGRTLEYTKDPTLSHTLVR